MPGQSPAGMGARDAKECSTLVTGRTADFNSFEIPALYGISKIAPYFHDNSAKTLRDVTKLYQLGFIAVRRVVPDFVPHPVRPDELPDDGRSSRASRGSEIELPQTSGSSAQ